MKNVLVSSFVFALLFSASAAMAESLEHLCADWAEQQSSTDDEYHFYLDYCLEGQVPEILEQADDDAETSGD